jgi:hypothetical protein
MTPDRNSTRYGEHWEKPFLYLAHSATKGKCCWCLTRESGEIHHAMYQDEKGLITDREIIGKHVFPVCKTCHVKTNQEGCHGRKYWITGKKNLNRNTDAAYERLRVGFKLLTR